MKQYSKSELKKIAIETFVRFPDTEKIYLASDGQAFLTEHIADMHAQAKKLRLYSFEKRADASRRLSVEELTDLVKKTKDLNKLEKLLKAEEQSKSPRKSVFQIITHRIKQLTS